MQEGVTASIGQTGNVDVGATGQPLHVDGKT